MGKRITKDVDRLRHPDGPNPSEVTKYCGVLAKVAKQPHKLKVAGSTPASATISFGSNL